MFRILLDRFPARLIGRLELVVYARVAAGLGCNSAEVLVTVFHTVDQDGASCIKIEGDSQYQLATQVKRACLNVKMSDSG